MMAPITFCKHTLGALRIFQISKKKRKKKKIEEVEKMTEKAKRN